MIFLGQKLGSVIQPSEGSRFGTTFQYFVISVTSFLEITLISMLIYSELQSVIRNEYYVQSVRIRGNAGLLKMIVRVLTTRHTQYT